MIKWFVHWFFSLILSPLYQLTALFMYLFVWNEWWKNYFTLSIDEDTFYKNHYFFLSAEEHLYGKMEDQKEFPEDVTHGLMPDFPGLNLKETEIVWLFWIMFTKIGLNIMMLLVTIRNLPFANALEENEKKFRIQITLCLSFSLSCYLLNLNSYEIK